MSRNFVSIILSTLCVASVAIADSNPILTRQDLMDTKFRDILISFYGLSCLAGSIAKILK